MATILFILSIAVIPLIVLSPIVCHFVCGSCRNRHEQMKIAMQMKVARDIAAMKRASQPLADHMIMLFARQRRQSHD